MIKKCCLILLLVCIITSCTNKQEIKHIDLPSEVKAMWFSYVDFDKNFKDVNSEEAELKVEEIINNCDELGINTLFVHAVAFTDAYYDSNIYERSSRISPDIDYLQIFVEKAHEKNMHIEAWINPMRSVTKQEMESFDDEHKLKNFYIKNESSYLKLYEDRFYLDISHEQARDKIKEVVDELCTNYEIDGIHMDDYFYPANADEEFDKEEFYNSGENNLATFRRNNVNQLVEELHDEIKNKNLVFGISPSGNLGYSRDVIFGDVEAWIKNNSLDYIMPQIYWGYTNKNKPFYKTLNEWNELVKESNVDLIVGLAAYKIGVPSKDSDQEEWNTDETVLVKQIQDCSKMSNYKGFGIFSYHSLFTECGQLGEINKENMKKMIK